ncbi:phage virion morphogenesis protein [Hydrogenophaga electricum]|uniref:Virion morphogenesis protein n=1 Tax=Hydrogenophaga electricum TaxID=1230953 RepID=A0ABQ6C152_9BURK|nr:phage virion morphogenesis protein [Hydrogenophaga electricum]GLS13590.1 virion morphogenesis protein [Hydrogenophaga electricum]
MAEDRADLATLEALVRALDGAGRRRLMRRIVQDVRREQGRRIGRQQDPDGKAFAPRSINPASPDQKRGPMFKGLRLIRSMTVQASESDGAVGFVGRVERIARVHQLGEMDRPRPRLRPVRYPVRQLLGVSSQTEAVVWDALQRHLVGGG